MAANLNAYFKERIIESITTLSSQIFPQLVKVILEHQTNAIFELRGQTVSGEPVGYTLDANSKHFEKVFEVGKEAQYFKDKRNSKIKGDIRHCMRVAPQCQYIYLASNRPCGPKKYAYLNTYAVRLGRRLNKEINIYDSRYLGEYIVDQFIEKHDVFNIEKLVPLVPALQQIKNEFLFTNDLPQLPNSNIERKDAKAIVKKLQNSKVIIIYGISGIGKTYLALQVVEHLQSTMKDWTPLWIPGSVFREDADPKSLTIDKLGIPVNLIGLMERFKHILIIDSLEKNLEEIVNTFETQVKNDYKLIITSQTSIKTITRYRVKALNKELSKKILNSNLTNICPDDLFEIIYKGVNGHPFLLNQVNSSIRKNEITWKKISEEIEHITAAESRNSRSFYQTLFLNHINAAESELGFLKWLDTNEIEYALMETMIATTGISKLVDRDFFNVHNTHGFVLHDIVFKSLQSAKIDFDGDKLQEKFRKELEKLYKAYEPKFYRIIHMHSDLIRRIAFKDKSHIFFIYCHLLTTTLEDFDERDLPEFKLKDVEKAFKNYRDIDYFFIMSWIEFIELTSRKLRAEKDFDGAKDYLQERIKEIKNFLQTSNKLKDSIKLDIKNHLGKFVKNTGDDEEAAEIFNDILNSAPNFWAAKFHLAKLYRKSKAEEAQQYLLDILNAYGSANDVSPTIVLAAFKELKIHPGFDQEIVDRFIQSFDQLLFDTMVSKFDLPYEVLGALSAKIHFHEPQKMIDLTSNLPIPSENAIENQTLFNVGQIYFNTAKAYSYINDEPKLKEYAQHALAYYGKLKRPGAFEKRYIAETHLLLKDPASAFKLLLEVPDNPKDRELWWNYTYAKTFLLNEQYQESLDKINHSISLDKDDRNSSTLYRQRALIYDAMNNNACMTDYYYAIKHCISPKFKGMMEEELKLAQIKFN